MSCHTPDHPCADGAFVAAALAQIRLAVTGLIGWTNLHIRKTPLPRWQARRASSRLRTLEILVRRLILLMALSLPPVRCAAHGAGSRLHLSAHMSTSVQTHEPAPARPEAHTLTSPDGAAVPVPRPRHLRLMPRLMSLANGLDWAALPRRTGPVPVEALCARIAAMQRVLSDPGAHAERLARRLGRQRATGAPAPVVLPAPRLNGATPELVLTAGALPRALTRALKVWDTS